MTCAEFQQTTSTSVTLATNAAVAAVISHGIGCRACRDWLHNKRLEEQKSMTADDTAQADRVVFQRVAALFNDAEACEQIGSSLRRRETEADA